MRQMEWKEHQISLERIGRGLYSKVYRAYDPVMQKPVAVKRVKDVEIAKREADVMKRYGHSPYLPELYDFFTYEGRAYLIMEFVEGSPFGQNFDSHGRKLDEKQSVQITINILRGLQHLHRSGYVHNDIKPKNVMMTAGHPDTVKVIDFNRCQIIDDADAVQKDLQDATRMCLFLINGKIGEDAEKSDIPNERLKTALRKAFGSTAEERYGSAEQYIEALLPYG